MKYFSIFGQKFEIISFIIVFLSVIFLIYLGTWQLNRLEQKKNFINKIEHNISNPPSHFNDHNTDLYSKVELSGHFLNEQNIFLYGRRSAYPQKDGYYFLSPFQDLKGHVYLVSRGWVPANLKDNAMSFKTNSEEKITAFVMPGEDKKFFTPDNDLKNNIWFNIDLAKAQKMFNLHSDKFYLMQIDSQNLPNGAKKLTTKYLNIVRNDHLEYAITWYSLAGFLCIIYFIYSRKN